MSSAHGNPSTIHITTGPPGAAPDVRSERDPMSETLTFCKFPHTIHFWNRGIADHRTTNAVDNQVSSNDVPKPAENQGCGAFGRGALRFVDTLSPPNYCAPHHRKGPFLASAVG